MIVKNCMNFHELNLCFRGNLRKVVPKFFEVIGMKRWILFISLLMLLAAGCTENFVSVEATSPAFVFFYTEN